MLSGTQECRLSVRAILVGVNVEIEETNVCGISGKAISCLRLLFLFFYSHPRVSIVVNFPPLEIQRRMCCHSIPALAILSSH